MCRGPRSLGDNDILERGAVALGKALEVNSSLKTVEYVGAWGGVYASVANTLWCWRVVPCSLGDNCIGDGGAAALGKALEVNSRLQSLKYAVTGVNTCETIVKMHVVWHRCVVQFVGQHHW